MVRGGAEEEQRRVRGGADCVGAELRMVGAGQRRSRGGV